MKRSLHLRYSELITILTAKNHRPQLQTDTSVQKTFYHLKRINIESNMKKKGIQNTDIMMVLLFLKFF